MGLPAVMYIADEYNVIKDNQFNFEEAQKGLTEIHNNPSVLVSEWKGLFGNDKYMEKVLSGVINDTVTINIDGDDCVINTVYNCPAKNLHENVKTI